MRYRKALLVDDEVLISMAVSRRIRIGLGIESDTATDSVDALEKARNNKYDLCICDGLNGDWIDIYNYFKSESPETRFMLYSGDDKQLSMADGCGIERYDKLIEFEKMIASLKE